MIIIYDTLFQEIKNFDDARNCTLDIFINVSEEVETSMLYNNPVITTKVFHLDLKFQKSLKLAKELQSKQIPYSVYYEFYDCEFRHGPDFHGLYDYSMDIVKAKMVLCSNLGCKYFIVAMDYNDYDKLATIQQVLNYYLTDMKMLVVSKDLDIETVNSLAQIYDEKTRSYVGVDGIIFRNLLQFCEHDK